jgi:hypothetical protein
MRKRLPSNELAPAFRCRSLRSLFLGCRFEVLAHCIPVYDIPNCFQIIRPTILVLEVVGVFPHVDTKHRLCPGNPVFPTESNQIICQTLAPPKRD